GGRAVGPDLAPHSPAGDPGVLATIRGQRRLPARRPKRSENQDVRSGPPALRAGKAPTILCSGNGTRAMLGRPKGRRLGWGPGEGITPGPATAGLLAAASDWHQDARVNATRVAPALKRLQGRLLFLLDVEKLVQLGDLEDLVD